MKQSLLGNYANCPQKFKILIGDRKLLQKIIKHTEEKVKQIGYVYFDDVCVESSDDENGTMLENGKYIFCDPIDKNEKNCQPPKVNSANRMLQGPKADPKETPKRNVILDIDLSNDQLLISDLRTKLEKRIKILENNVNDANNEMDGFAVSRNSGIWNNLAKFI